MMKSFRIRDIFEIATPIARSDKDYEPGRMPYVASGKTNNGICAYLKPKLENDFDEGNCITISPIDGYAFYQKGRFLARGGSGSSILILRSEQMTEASGLFIAAALRTLCSG